MLKRKSKRRAAYVDLPERIYSWLDGRRNVVLLETSRYDAHNHRSFLFFDPIRVESIHRVGEVGELLHTLQAATTQGYYAAGYVAYECGAYFEPARLSVDMKADHEQPLAWFGIYRAPVIFDHATGVLSGLAAGELAEEIDEGDILSGEIGAIHDVEFDQTPADYAAQIARIMEYIRAGDTYQVNYTGRYRFRLSGSPLALYRRLRGKQRISHGAYLSGDDWQIACLSPELFFRIDGDTITVKPMKGTAPRGRTPAEDCQQADWLRNDEKNRAENVMIVDLLRNDLGRLCRVGSVHVPDLFTVERYETLFQMTSTVAGALASDRSYTALFRSLFPCGSVTGAPKIRAMQIIHELERRPRGVYTGAIGYFAPSFAPSFDNAAGQAEALPTAHFNVAIRTIVLRDGQGEMGVGGGIVADSHVADEYAECMLKARFLAAPPIEFSLLESILWYDRFRHLERHLQRLEQSAAYFGFPITRSQALAALRREAEGFEPGSRYKVRLTVDHRGAVCCESTRIAPEPASGIRTVMIAQRPTDSRDRFLFHKTTNRRRYDEAYQQAVAQGYTDAIFVNERGEVTEGAISNIFVRRDGWWLTPPIHCGLLNGIYRQHVLRARRDAREAILHLKDLYEADEIAICNAIRGWRRVKLAVDEG